ncbi:MAG TPA: hypothetical protein P5572_20035 [Phycisphaerae bacterium]|mgnify:CR=1 FL=1|nr:hypothetical protein [Phycisphaerales bacterium]HRX87322.1 hypothetical protein [Phycisphaerae bacterium]
MPSRKQKILAELMHVLICRVRGPQSRSGLFRLRHGRLFHQCFEHLNLIHRIPHSILTAEYTENDISFINWGIAQYVHRLGADISPLIAWLLAEFMAGVPAEWRGEVTYEPPAEFLALAAQYDGGLLY